MAKITYANKTNLTPVVDATKQSTAEDWNESKKVVNQNYDSLFAKFKSFCASYNSAWIPQGFAFIEDSTPTDTLNHAYQAAESGTIFGVSGVVQGDILVGTGSTGYTVEPISDEVDGAKLKSKSVDTYAINNEAVGLPQLSQVAKDFIGSGGSVTNNPDEEDITSFNNELKFRDRTPVVNGKRGYRIIREDFDWSNLPTGFDNCIWEIRYDFDLGGLDVVLPEGVELYFNGGFIKNGYLVGLISNKVIKVEWFPDADLIQLLSKLDITNKIIELEDNKTYSVDGKIELRKSGFTLNGNGAILDFISWTTGDTRIICTLDGAKTDYSYSNTVVKDSNVIPLSQTIFDSIELGDLIYVNDQSANLYNEGFFGEVIEKTISNEVVIGNLSQFDLTFVNVSVMKPIEDILIKDLTIKLNDEYSSGISIFYAKNAKVNNCHVLGNLGMEGIACESSINCEISENYVEKFFDKLLIRNITGYGISVSGLDIKVSRNEVNECRHCITSANRLFVSERLLFDNNKTTCLYGISGVVYASPIDFHGNAQGIIKENEVIVKPISVKAEGDGISVRGSNSFIKDNVIRNLSDTYSTYGMVLFENIKRNITIKGNKFFGLNSVYFLISRMPNIDLTNLQFVNNYFENGGIEWGDGGEARPYLFDSEISNNYFNCDYRDSLINFGIGVERVTIKDNIFHSSRQKVSASVKILSMHDSENGEGIIIKNNIFRADFNQDFVFSYLDNSVIVTENVFDCPYTNLIYTPSSSYSNVKNCVDFSKKVNIGMMLSGGSAFRPTLSSRFHDIGVQYLDTTLGYVITWNGSSWIDSTGTTV